MKILTSIAIVSSVISVIAASLADILLTVRVAVWGAFAGLQYSLNPGIAWGIRLPNGIQELCILAALVIVASMARYAESRVSITAYGMIIGGGLGNVIDRLRDGYVTDFIQIGSFPIFNVADMCVSIGVAILLLEAIFPTISAFKKRK